MARPSKYTPELGKEIAKRIAQGESVEKISKDDGMPCEATFYNWLFDHKEFLEEYVNAGEARAHARFEDIDKVISEARRGEVDPTLAKLIIDTKKWQVGKENRIRYGDRQIIDNRNVNKDLDDVKEKHLVVLEHYGMKDDS